MVLGSDSSSRKAMDYMPKKEIHGQIPVVTPCSRQALNQFEMNARKGDMTMQNGSHSGQCMSLLPAGKLFNSWVFDSVLYVVLGSK